MPHSRWFAGLLIGIVAAHAHAQTTAPQTFSGGEPVEFSTTPEGLPAEELQIRDFDFSPDGLLLAAAYGRWTTTGVVRVYELATKKLVQTLPLPKGASAVDFSADGRWLSASCWDHKVYVWDTAGYQSVATFVGGTKAVRAVFSPDAKWLGVASEAGELALWDTNNWQQTKKFAGDLFRFQHLAFSPDAKRLCAAGGSFDNPRFGRALVFDVETGKQQLVLNAGNQPIGGVAFSPDAQSIATGGFDGIVRLWDAASGQQRAMMTDPLGSGGSIERVAFSPDGKTIAAGHPDSMIRLWNASDGNFTSTRIQQPAYVLAVAYSPDGTKLASGGDDKIVHILDAKKQTELFTLHPLTETSDVPSPILALAASRDGRFLATAHEDLSVRLRDAATGKVLRTFSGHTDVVAAAAFSPDSKRLATASYDRTIKLWTLEGEAMPQTLSGHTNWVFAVEFSADGSRLASSGYDKTVRLWDAADGKQLQQFMGHTATVRSLAFSRDGQKIVSGSADRTARVWDLAKPGTLLELKGHEAAIRAVAFAPDGGTVATAGEDNSVRIWDAATGKELRTLSGHTNMVWCLAFSPGGRTLASGGFDNSIRVWDPQTGKSLQELKGHTDVVAAVVYASDSRALITASYDKTLKRWAAKNPPVPPLADLQVAEAGGARFGFVASGGKTLVTGSNTGHVQFWDLATGEKLKTVKQQRGMAGGEISRDGTRLITSGYGSQVYLWDLVGQRQLATIDIGHPDSIAVAISSDNTKIAAGGNDGAVAILDVASQSKLHDLPGDGLPVGGLEFSPDGTMLATATGNYKEWQKPGSVKLWDVATGKEIAALPGTKSKMRRVRFTADGQLLLACGAQNEVLVYDVASRTLKFTLPTDDEMSDIALLPDRRTVVIGQYKGILSLYDLIDKKKIGELDGHRDAATGKYVFGVSVSPDGSVVVSAAGDSRARLWSVQPTPAAGTAMKSVANAKAAIPLAQIIRAWPAKGVTGEAAPAVDAVQAVAVRELSPHGQQVWFAVYSPDGSRLATGGSDRVVRIWDAATFEQRWELKGHTNYITHAAWSPDGRRLATAAWDKTVAVWDVDAQQRLAVLEGHELGLRKVAWSADGKHIAAGGEDGKVCLWDTESFSRRHVIEIGLPAYSVAFSPDSQTLAVGSGDYKNKLDGRISFWSPATGKRLRDLDGSIGNVFHLAYLSGDRLLAANAGEGVAVWDLESGKLETTYRTVKDVRWLEASRDGKRIVAAHYDGKSWISVWDRDTTRPLVTFNGHQDFGLTAAFTPDGKQIVSGAGDGKLKVWELKPTGQSVAKKDDNNQ